MIKLNSIASLIDHAVLHPTHGDEALNEACTIAARYGVASLCVKPYAVPDAVNILQGSGVDVSCVAGFPAGNSFIEAKMKEAAQACSAGAKEVDFVINIAKVLDADWGYIENEVISMTQLCHSYNALVKVIFETDYINDRLAIKRLCEICTHAGADFVKTSTGFGYNKLSNGHYQYTGATLDNVRWMKANVGKEVRVKASGGIRTLEELVLFKEAGCDRIGTSSTEAIMKEITR